MWLRTLGANILVAKEKEVLYDFVTSLLQSELTVSKSAFILNNRYHKYMCNKIRTKVKQNTIFLYKYVFLEVFHIESIDGTEQFNPIWNGG